MLSQTRPVRQNFAARGEKTQGVPFFSNAILDVCSNRWGKNEMGVRIPLPPLAMALS